ncbi:glycosyltransferase family 9 protein [Thiorhodospira sibirica]|uniref:glycosyltransferase family 9 protein n=1 Tax=Thiorhodospira sibirica TaxID=154347 RepID=UPI0002D50D63|nr:glycosyltransferase family 9 protein [Thiorhodospira sibirica]
MPANRPDAAWPPPMRDQRERILIIRLSAIGDVVMASAFVHALRASWPEAHISWLVEPVAADLLRHNPDIDQLIIWPKTRWQRLWRARDFKQLGREVRPFIAALRQAQYSRTIDLQGLFKSGVWAWLSGAPVRIGLGSREGSAVLMTHRVPRGGDPLRMGSEYLYLAEQLGLDTAAFCLQVGISAADRQVAAALVQSHAPGGYIVGCPFTTRPQKHWVEAHWIALAQALEQRFGLPLVLLGGPGDQQAAQRITQGAAVPIIDLTGQTSLTQAAALIAQARLLIGVDTGLTHIGPAFKVPTIALFGSTCPYRDAAQDNAVVLYHAFVCSPCRRQPSCEGKFGCMRAIEVAEVMRHAQRLLGNAS